MSRVGVWPVRLLWLSLPLVAGPTLASALDPARGSFRTVASIGLWVVWFATLCATLVPRTISLTFVRLTAPASVVACGWAAAAVSEVGAEEVAAIGFATLAAAAVFLPWTADEFVNGSSYGAERRMSLRVPLLLALGPIELTWAVAVAGAVTGPLLLADQRWTAGAIAIVVGLPATVLALRSLHTLARRWVVFVPAGFVLHDPIGLDDPVLVTRQMVSRLGPAPPDTTALDVTAGALGLALELELVEPVKLSPRANRGDAPVAVRDLLFTPQRPGALLAEAASRRIPVSLPG